MARKTAISFNVRNAGSFFANKTLLRDLQRFQEEVEADPNKYQRGILLGFATQFDIYGIGELDRMFSALIARDFGGSPEPRQLRFLTAMLERHQGLWTQAITKAFATAQNSVEGKTQFGQPTILRRIVSFFLGEETRQGSLGFFTRAGRVFSVRKLISDSAEETIIDVSVASLKWILNSEVWWIDSPTVGTFKVSPNQVMAMIRNRTYPDDDVEDHKRRIDRADLNFPIILQQWGLLPRIFGRGQGVIDGYHRLAKAVRLGRKSIKAQVRRGGVPTSVLAVNFKIPTEEQLRPQLLGIARVSTRGNTKSIFKMRLAPFIQMLYKTLGMNFRRDFEIMVTRFAVSEKDGEQLFLINSHLSQVSSRTCRLCAGRVFTRDALRYAAQQLSPNLFHPNCVHYVVKSFQETTETYNGRQGQVVNVAEVNRWVSQGRTKRAKRPAPVSINV